MNKVELHHLCGLDQVPTKKPAVKWQQGTLRFIGADNYVLGTKNVAYSFEHVDKGFVLMFEGERLLLPAKFLLGPRQVQGTLYDVELVTPIVVMSLAKMKPDRYPVVLRNDAVVDLT